MDKTNGVHLNNQNCERKRFEDKVVIITGSSSGIGQHAAIQFAKEGACVVIHGRNEKNLQETEEMLLKEGVSRNKILQVLGSLSNMETPKLIIDETIKTFGKINVLVNNAGASRRSDLKSLDIENMDFLYESNFRSAVVMTKLAIPYLEKTKGNVVQISSTASVVSLFSETFYSAFKAALDQFTRCFAVKYGPKGVRLNCLNPGFIKTNIVERLGVSMDHKLETLNWIEDNTPLRRIGTVDEVTPAILFLASDDASYVTGSTWLLDGGMHVFLTHNEICDSEK